MLGHFWEHVWHIFGNISGILGNIWEHFGNMLGTFWEFVVFFFLIGKPRKTTENQKNNKNLSNPIKYYLNYLVVYS